jgi:hypothetical protein
MWKHQIPNESQSPKYETKSLGHLKLEFGAYLGFGICDLGIYTLCPMPYALCDALVTEEWN